MAQGSDFANEFPMTARVFVGRKRNSSIAVGILIHYLDLLSVICTLSRHRRKISTFFAGHYSHMIIDRWKQRLSECQNASAVHLLRSYLDSRIDWKKSVVEKVILHNRLQDYGKS